MTPLLTGVFASQISGHLTPPFTLQGNYDALATVTVPSGGLSSITFAGIPQTGYSHLQIRYIARNSSLSSNTVMTFNSDTASNYSTHYLVGNGTSPSAGAVSNSSFIYTDVLTQSSTSFAPTIVDILDYANTSKNKTARSLSGIDLNGSGTIWLASGAWRNTTAINSITLKISDNFAFAQYSQFALYGVK